MSQESWDRDFLALAQWWGERRSKDPSTKVGAVITDQTNNIIGTGYNGFPRGVDDLQERYLNRQEKYSFIVHAEANAILNSVRGVQGATLYCYPIFTCQECAKMIIQSGIRRVVVPKPRGTEAEKRWAPTEAALAMYQEAGIRVDFIDV